MGLLDPRHTPERVRRHHEPRGADDAEHDEQGDDHGAAGRVVAQMAPGAESQDVAQIGGNPRRAADEIGEPRMSWSDEAPGDPDGHEAHDHIARDDMHPIQFIGGCPGRDEGREQAPMQDPDERVPHLDLRRDLRRPRIAAGFGDDGAFGVHHESLPVFTTAPVAGFM